MTFRILLNLSGPVSASARLSVNRPQKAVPTIGQYRPRTSPADGPSLCYTRLHTVGAWPASQPRLVLESYPELAEMGQSLRPDSSLRERRIEGDQWVDKMGAMGDPAWDSGIEETEL